MIRPDTEAAPLLLPLALLLPLDEPDEPPLDLDEDVGEAAASWFHV